MALHPPPTTILTPPPWLSLVQVRRLTKADLPALEWNGEYARFRRLFAETYHSSVKGRAVLWVADLPGQGLIGQVFVQLNSARLELADGKTRAYIYAFRVRQAYRGVGLGTRLLQTAETDLIRRGYHWVTLNVGRDNPNARRLYERNGYRVVASEPGIWHYYDETGQRREVNEPAWRMEKKLTDPR
jgi:ribosomal protein S18 acetylase RimI-like enzyme